MFCSFCFTAIHVSRRLHPHWWQRCFATASEWKRWQRRCDRLTQLQQRIKFPQPKSITVEGVTYALPLANAGPPKHEPTQEELEYLVGFFDGDGCVTMKTQRGEISLQITQSIDSAEVLLLFRDKLGGGVSRQSTRTGLQKACLAWQAYSSTMCHAALLLGRIPSMKQRQLQMAAGTPADKEDRAKVTEQLKAFKGKDYSLPNLTFTWPQFAGFFDAEGFVGIHPSFAAIKLSISQVNPCVLEHLLAFLHANGLERWRLYGNGKRSELSCTELPTAKRTLELLLSSGLRLKKMQAELALSLNASNHQQVREDIMNLNGWQGRYNRLDKEGSLLAKRINALQNKSTRSSCTKERKDLGRMIQDMQEKLAFHKLVSRCRSLRANIRQCLSEGALLLPSWNSSQRKVARPISPRFCKVAQDSGQHCILRVEAPAPWDLGFSEYASEKLVFSISIQVSMPRNEPVIKSRGDLMARNWCRLLSKLNISLAGTCRTKNLGNWSRLRSKLVGSETQRMSALNMCAFHGKKFSALKVCGHQFPWCRCASDTIIAGKHPTAMMGFIGPSSSTRSKPPTPGGSHGWSGFWTSSTGRSAFQATKVRWGRK